jgi:transposase
VSCIRTVLAGKTYLAPAAAAKLAEGVTRVQLTPREMSTLKLLADGKANKEIATALDISERTVKTHLAHLFEKLGQLNLPAGSRVKVWVQDEARIGLHDPPRRCWGLRGVRVVKPRQQEYQWCYVCGALEVVSGAAEFQLLPTVGLELTQGFLEQIAASDSHAQHVIIWDQAGFHFRPGDSRLPERVHVLPLPAYSPELNPAERLWDVLKDVLCNRVYAGIQALEDAACEALQPFLKEADRVRALVGHGWLHLQANAS